MTTSKSVHETDKQFRLENRGYIYSLLNYKCTHVVKVIHGGKMTMVVSRHPRSLNRPLHPKCETKKERRLDVSALHFCAVRENTMKVVFDRVLFKYMMMMLCH